MQKTDETGLTIEERLIRFCETPKSKKEITIMLGISVKSCTWVWQKYLLPLIESGKLKMTIPNNRGSKNQRFLSGDVATATEDAVIEFCKEPKSRSEINEHFGLTYWTSWTHIKPLIESGKLNLTMPSVGMTSPRQKYTTQEVDAPALTDETLKEFCRIPRSRGEITAHFNLEIQSARRYIAAKANEGIIQRTIPNKPESPNQKFVATNMQWYR